MQATDVSTCQKFMSTQLKQWGTSRAVRIPKSVCEDADISTGSELTMETGVDAHGPYILIRPASSAHRSFSDVPFISMDEVFEGYDGTYHPREAAWGADVGMERLA